MSVDTSPAGTVPEWLSTSADLVTPALARAIDTLHPDLARMARYHRGWTDRDGHPVPDRPRAKGVRPALVLWSAEATGADPATAVAAAVAVELVHDFSLLHDDIMDNDVLRRGRPTAWHVYGPGPAVLLGDTLHALAHQILADEHPHGATAAATLASAVLDLCRGQAADLAFEHRAEVSVPEYLAMVEGKTCALARCATSLGAILTGANPTTTTGLRRLGGHVGLMYQMVDDLLGIFGDPHVTGKPAGADLARRKKTLPILAAVAAPTPAGRELATVLSAPRSPDDDLARAVHLVDEAGGRTHTARAIAEQHREAHQVLTALALPGEATRKLRELLAFLASRTT